jgi:hypothetical protein
MCGYAGREVEYVGLVCGKQFMAWTWQIRRAGWGLLEEAMALVHAGQQSWMRCFVSAAAFTSSKEWNRFIYNVQLCGWSFTGSCLLTGLGSDRREDCCQCEEAALLVETRAEFSSHMLRVGSEGIETC